MDLSFQIELSYDKESFYDLVVPNLVSVLEDAAVRKLADSVSVTVIDKGLIISRGCLSPIPDPFP